MSITRMDTLMQEARAQGRAVAALECWDSNSIQAITIAAQRTGASVIIQASPPEYEYCGGADALKAMVDWYTTKAGITAALHLDHGSTLEQVGECLRAGFSSVMLDGSRHPYERNLELTRAAAVMAHEYDASAEGELGHVGGLEGDLEDEDPGAAQTDPQQARVFAADTGVDCLAVAIGTVHGVYKGTPHINLERLRDIAAAVPLPLVLHGGSGTPDGTLQECIRLGVAKINICTELQQAWTAGIAESVRTLAIGAPGRFYTPARERLIQAMIEKIRLFSFM